MDYIANEQCQVHMQSDWSLTVRQHLFFLKRLFMYSWCSWIWPKHCRDLCLLVTVWKTLFLTWFPGGLLFVIQMLFGYEKKEQVTPAAFTPKYSFYFSFRAAIHWPIVMYCNEWNPFCGHYRSTRRIALSGQKKSSGQKRFISTLSIAGKTMEQDEKKKFPNDLCLIRLWEEKQVMIYAWVI